MQDYPFYYTPKSIKIEVGDLWVHRFHPERTALITKDWGQTSQYPDRIGVLYFGGHHPKGGDKALPTRHCFRSHYRPFPKKQ